jgi:Predicted membrane protein (DUF2339)
MFIIIIVVIGIVLYLANLNSRINNLENKLSNLDTVSKIENISAIIPKPQIQPNAEIQKEVVVKTPIAPHQDNFAQNLAKFGIAILILGVLFFLNYLDKQGLIGPVFKYVAGLSFGIGLLGVAEYLKNKSIKYTNLLRGAAFIIFYLTLFVGYIMFKIVALPLTLGLVMAVLAVSAIISIRENDELPFTLGVLGAYMVSFLVNVNFYNLNQENTLGILSYVMILNIAVLAVAFSKQWINSAVIGFVFTWIIFVSTMSADIGKAMLFVFSTIYGLQYLIVFLLQDFKKDKIMHNTVFLTVINTIVYLMVFYKLVDKTFWFDYVGFLVALLGAFHFIVYIMLRSINKTSEGVITLTHFVISVLLITVAIPLQFDGPLVTMIWFFEGIMLSFLSVLKDFKDKPIMYVLGFASIVAGIAHMIIFGDYKTVLDSGTILLNQSYIVWFGVFALINLIAYIWYNTVFDSMDVKFKTDISKAAFALILIGQVMFVTLTSFEINSFGKYRVNIVNNEINTQMELDRKLNSDQNNYLYNYDYSKYEEETQKIDSINKQTTFMQILLFIFMTIIYFVVGLVKKNNIVRNMGIVTLVITSVLLITLTLQLGPVYRIITFVGFGILLLIISYLYISKNKKPSIPNALMMFLMIGLFAGTADAKVIETKNWTYFGELQSSQIDVSDSVKDNQNLYVLPINKDVINLSKKNDLSDIRIIDKSNNEIPYILVKSNQNTQDIKDSVTQVKILENSLTKEGKKILVLDTNKEGALYNNLRLLTDSKSQNFRKKVRVYISDSFLTANSSAWREFEQRNIIYNYTNNSSFTVEKLDINLTGVSSRYMKIELVDDTEFDKNIKVNNQINIASAEIKYLKSEDKNVGYKIKDYLSGNFMFDNLSIYRDVKVLGEVKTDDKTEVVYEGDIDVEALTLKVDSSEKNFNRNIVIQGSNNDIDWITLSNGSIYRIDSPVYKGENLSISILPSTYKKFKVIVQNNNNKPLDILKTGQVKLQNTGVIFKVEGEPVSDLRIIVGNNIEAAPIYDIRNTINYFEEVAPRIIQYKELIKNPDYVPVKNVIPFGERNKVFLNIALLLFIAIMGIFGFFWMKNTHHE